MNIICPVCDDEQHIADFDQADQVTQGVCVTCEANLLFVTRQGSSPRRAAGRTSRGLTHSRLRKSGESGRKNIMGVGALLLLCALNYTLLGAGIYGLRQSIKAAETKGSTLRVFKQPQASTHAQGGSHLRENQIQTLFQSVDRAANERNVTAIMAYLSDDVVITASLQLPSPNPTKTLTFTRDQYRQTLRQTFATAKEYGFLRKVTRIAIAQDGKSAQVASQTLESVTIAGSTTQVQGQETVTLELREGKPLITKVQAVGNVEIL